MRLKTAAGAFALLASAAASAAPTVIDFEAVALRGANSDPTQLPTATEYANGNGMTVSQLVAGQKTYYGTTAFGGQTVGSLGTIAFTYRPQPNGLPYVNLGITNGTTTGVLALTSVSSTTNNGDGSISVVYTVATAGLGFYERVGPDPLFNGLDFSDISSWTLLDVARTLSSGEANAAGQARGPVDHSLAILWGDSANNYLGEKEIYDVTVTMADGSAFVTGNASPNPARWPSPAWRWPAWRPLGAAAEADAQRARSSSARTQRPGIA